MKRKPDPKRTALVARIESLEAKSARALAALKGKFTRYTGLIDDVKRLKRQLREMDNPKPLPAAASDAPAPNAS